MAQQNNMIMEGLKLLRYFAVSFIGYWVFFSFLWKVNHPWAYIEWPIIEVNSGTDPGDTEFCRYPQRGSGSVYPITRTGQKHVHGVAEILTIC